VSITSITVRQLYWINKLQDLKTFPTGAFDKKDEKINKIIHRIYNEYYKKKM
jgi:hypothetical protein